MIVDQGGTGWGQIVVAKNEGVKKKVIAEEESG
jgi:hypothetical protein